jgi:hypothetical protein
VIDSVSATEALWLETMHQICSRAAHEVKGALNGVSVNLDVVRSRAEKPDAPASNVAKFANAASEQLETVIAMTVALLWISRPTHQPVELARVVSHLNVLLAPAARADGRRLAAAGDFGELGTTSADGQAVRLAIGGCLLAASDASVDVEYRAATHEAGPTIRIESCDGGDLSIGQEIVAAVRAAGILIWAEPAALFISFPR